MCSVFGIVLRDSRPIPSEWRDATAKIMRHRGPDHHGEFTEPGVLLSNDRLAIIDTAGGTQPIFGTDERLVIVYNGELFNHAELRGELEKKGYRFRTRTDTEVVLLAFEAYGPACVERFNGMFAFLIWDRVERRLFAARDRLGIKPLYYCHLADGIALASEAKGLLPIVPGGASADWGAVGRYFTLGYVPPTDSPFTGIHKFPAGHFGWIDARAPVPALSITQYWRPQFGTDAAASAEEAVARVDELLSKAVGQELMSDVPLGVFLSSGLDSSAIAYYGAKRAGRDLMSFTLRFEEQTHDESADSRAIARHLGLDHHELTLTPELMREGLRKVADNLDEPFADSTVLPLRIISDFARQYVKVVLTGWGGDEIFAGYPTLRAHRMAQYYRQLPGFLARDLIPFCVNRLPVSDSYLSFEFKAKKFVTGLGLPPELQHFVWMGYFDDTAKQRLFRPEIAERLREDTFAMVTSAVGRLAESDLTDRIMNLDSRFFLQGNGLFQADRMTMAASLEARVPMLNNSVVDYVMPLPASLKMPGGELKGLLKRALRRHLPAEIIDKPKKGFGPPSAAWTRGVLSPVLDVLFSEERVRSQGIFEPAEIRRLLHEHRSRARDHGRSLWALLSFQLWYDRFIGGANHSFI